MENGRCTKGCPKAFAEETTVGPNGYPIYRRRNNGTTLPSSDRDGLRIDNRWVVPHNQFLAAKYSAYINVEICTSGTALKYLFKYVYKGHTRATAVLNQEPSSVAQDGAPGQDSRAVDEISEFIDGRYVAASEAVWRIFGFYIHSAYPPVTRLQLHLPGQFMDAFDSDEPL